MLENRLNFSRGELATSKQCRRALHPARAHLTKTKFINTRPMEANFWQISSYILTEFADVSFISPTSSEAELQWCGSDFWNALRIHTRLPKNMSLFCSRQTRSREPRLFPSSQVSKGKQWSINHIWTDRQTTRQSTELGVNTLASDVQPSVTGHIPPVWKCFIKFLALNTPADAIVSRPTC